MRRQAVLLGCQRGIADHAVWQTGIGYHTKVMIGVAPITEEYARQIGEDGYAADASRAIELARLLMA